MACPLVIEVNTRCWLRDWSERLGRAITLETVPQEEILGLARRGFTHVWLMGAWTTGPRSRQVALEQSWLRSLCAEAFGGFHEEDVAASPYAIADYTVAPSYGGMAALRHFRARLAQHGLRLLLDFVPNHLGLDHPWVQAQPQWFVHAREPRPDSFRAGSFWIACGKDPYFPGWTDTAQIDYRCAATRAALIEILKSLSAECDGLRCDMAMLVLNDVFHRTWSHWPSSCSAPATEFWADAISTVKSLRPDFIFVAESYWDLEHRLRELGFDYCYDKKFYDHIVRREEWALQEHLRAVAARFEPVRFLENHDEPRIASILNFEEQKAATMLLLRQPAMRLLHDGQFIGRRRRTPVQFARYWPEPPDPEITALHEALLPGVGVS